MNISALFSLVNVIKCTSNQDVILIKYLNPDIRHSNPYQILTNLFENGSLTNINFPILSISLSLFINFLFLFLPHWYKQQLFYISNKMIPLCDSRARSSFQIAYFQNMQFFSCQITQIWKLSTASKHEQTNQVQKLHYLKSRQFKLEYYNFRILNVILKITTKKTAIEFT